MGGIDRAVCLGMREPDLSPEDLKGREMARSRARAALLFVTALILLATVMISPSPTWAIATAWQYAGPSTAGASSLGTDPATPTEIYAGLLYAPLYGSDSGGASWGTMNTWWLPSWNTVMSMAVDTATTPHTLYASWYGVYRTQDGGANWGWDVGGLGYGQGNYVDRLAVDTSSSPSTIYAATDSNGVYWSNNSGNTWTQGAGISGAMQPFGLVVDPYHPGTVYVGFYGNGVYKSTDYGKTWASAGNGINSYITGMTIDPSGVVWASTNGGGVYKSTDGGATWIPTGLNTSGYLPWDITSDSSGNIYAGLYNIGSYTGVYMLPSGSSTWSSFSTGLPGGDVNALMATPAALYAATDSGVYIYPLTITAVTNVSPNSGSTAGGTTVTIAGTGFTAASAVSFGSVAASSFTVDSDSQITAVSPSSPAGAVDVTVTRFGSASSTSSSDRFTYTVPLPTVTGISPTSGPTPGGTTVTITGTNFTGATSVTIGGAAATGVMVSSDTTITATTPAGTAGAQDVAVTTTDGTGTGTGLFTYIAVSTTTVVASSQDPSLTGQAVTFTATVTGASGTPTGSITFMDGATSLGAATLSGGTATYNTSALPAGDHSITAVYGGDANFSGSTSAAVTQAVYPTTVTVPAATGNGDITLSTNSPGCGFYNVTTETEAQVGDDPAFDYPYGLVQFSLSCAAADVTIAYPGSVAATYRKYGPTTPGNAATTKWYTFTDASVSGNSVTLHLVDGQFGDDTGVDGIIVDAGGSGQSVQQSSVAVPTMNGLGLMIFMLLAGLVSGYYVKRRRNTGR